MAACQQRIEQAAAGGSSGAEAHLQPVAQPYQVIDYSDRQSVRVNGGGANERHGFNRATPDTEKKID